MSGDTLKPEGEKDFAGRVRDLGLGELPPQDLKKEVLGKKQKSEDKANYDATLDMLMNSDIDNDNHKHSRKAERTTRVRKEAQRKKTLKERLILAGTAIALVFGVSSGAKAMDSRESTEKDREIPSREHIVKGNEVSDFEDDASGTNAALKANLENNNNVEGLQGVQVEKSQSEEYNEALKEMNDNDEYPGLELEDRSE